MRKFTWFILLIAQNAYSQPGLVGHPGFRNCNDTSGYDNHGILTGNPTCAPEQGEAAFLFKQNPAANLGEKPGGENIQLPACTSTCSGSLGENIFPNGDFGSGMANILPTNPNLAPGFIYQLNPPPNDGYYCIANNTGPWGSFAQTFWIDIEDNGPEPFGYMMVVNATHQPGLFYQNTVSICENTYYEFSIDIISLIKNHVPNFILPNISFLLDGNVVCETGNIPQDEQWRTVRFSFVSAPGQTTVTLALRNNAPGGGGNDLAIDNISLRACGPSITMPDTVFFCQGASTTVISTLSNAQYNNPVYLWQTFVNGAWQDIPNANTDTLHVLDPVDGSMVRLIVASSAANLSLPNCRVVSKTVLWKQLPSPVVHAAVQEVSCAGGSNASLFAETISGTAPYAYSWSSGESSPGISNLPVGNYAVTVTDAKGCTGIATASVSEPPLLTGNAIASDVSCFGGNNGAVSALVSGGVLPYTYTWNNGQTFAVLDNLIAGTYQATVTDANGCTTTTSATILAPSALASDVTASGVSCFGGNNGTAAALVSGGVSPYTYSWSNGQTDAILGNLAAGTYMATVTDANGCLTTTSATVAEPPALTSPSTASDVSCFGGNNGTVTVLANGGAPPYTITWSNGQTGAVLSNLVAGIYSATITDANACVSTTSALVAATPVLAGNIVSGDVSCFGGSNGTATALVSGGIAPYTYSWSNGQANATLSNLSTGIFQLTVTDANACTALASVNITEPPLLSVSAAANDVSCFGKHDGHVAAAGLGGQPPFSYTWDNGQTIAVNSNLGAGNYSVTITDALGCTGEASVSVSEPPQLTANTTVNNVSCFGGNDGEANAVAVGGVLPYTFSWSNGQTGAQLTEVMSGAYWVTVTDQNACSTVAAISVAAPLALAVNTAHTDIACFGAAEGTAVAAVSGGTPPYAYAWNNGQTNDLIINLIAGTYNVTTTDSQGCSSVSSVDVNQPAVLQMSALASPVSCHGGMNGAVSTTTNGGTGPYTYLWNDGLTTAQHPNLTAGLYSVTATDSHGCTQTAQATVVQPTALISTSSVENVDCHGSATGAVSVTVTGGTLPYNFHWNTGANSPQITQLPKGFYTLSMTDAQGCLLTSTVQVHEPPPLTLQTDKINIRCYGDQNGAVFGQAAGGVAPYALLWSNGQTTSEISGLNAGAYTLSVTDANGCRLSASEDLSTPIPQTVDLGLDMVINLGDFIDLQAIVNIPPWEVMDYTWWGAWDSLHCPNCDTYRFQPTRPGCQQVMVRSKKGCIALDTLCYRISPQRRVYAPNVFSPNGDGFNDYFTIFSDEGVKQILSLKVFNRWGGHIYQANNIQTNDEPRGWDGTFKGQDLNIDVFVWMAQIEFIDGEIIQMSGDVTLLR